VQAAATAASSSTAAATGAAAAVDAELRRYGQLDTELGESLDWQQLVTLTKFKWSNGLVNHLKIKLSFKIIIPILL
jgi:hypothetical protein